MILRSPEFEKRMRARLKKVFQQSPELRKERRVASRLATRARSPVAGRLISLITALAILGVYSSASGAFALGSAAVSLWAAGAAFKLGYTLLGMLYASSELYALHHLPLNHRQIFQVQSSKFLWNSCWTLVDFAAGYLLLAILGKPEPMALAASLLIGCFQGALIVSLAIHLAARFSHFPLAAISGVLRTSAVFLLFFGRSFLSVASDISSVVDLSNPCGWVNYVFRQAVFKEDWWMLSLLAPLLAILWFSRASWRRLQTAYYSLDGMDLELQHDSSGPQDVPAAGPGARRRGLTEITDELQSGEFARQTGWEQAGWLERLVLKVWTKRERLVAEFMLASPPRWSHVYHRTAVILSICALLLMALGEKGQVVLFVAGYILVTSAFSIFSKEWRGLQTSRGSGGFIPFYAFYPVTHGDLLRTIWKANFIRWLVAAPFFFLFGAFGGWVASQSPADGLELALRVWLILFALQPLMLLLAISSGTNDTSKGTLISTLVILFLLVPVLLGMLALCVAVFLIEPLSGALICLAALFALSLLCVGFQWIGSRRGWFDLVTNAPAKQG